MRRRCGWLLLGALLVLALLPAYSQLTGPAASRETCQANLQALYRATLAYASDNDGYYPLAVMRRPAPNVWLWWFDFVRPYADDPRVFCCPASQKAEEHEVYAEPEPLLPGLSFSPHWVSYGMGYWYARDHDPKAPYRPDTLTDVHNTLLFADSVSYLVSSNRGGWDVDARHEGALHVLLADGVIVSARAEYAANGDYSLRRVADGKPLTWQTLP